MSSCLEPRTTRLYWSGRPRAVAGPELYRRFLTGRPGNRPALDGITMFDAATVPVTRYRWRASNIPTPWTSNAGVLQPA